MEKPQGATGISLVAWVFFLWFDFAPDWSSHNSNVKVKSKCSRFLDSQSKHIVKDVLKDWNMLKSETCLYPRTGFRNWRCQN